jgi:D-glycero-D-manno-heptose 1,7-bisphosphate phosphatase
MSARRPAAFLDRDGVVNIDHGYVVRIEDFEFVAGTLDACRALAQRGFALVVITNQSGIGRGLYSEADYHTLTAWMRAQFAAAGAPLAGVYHCPHHPTDAHGIFRVECDCRKPAPGMLLRAAEELDLDLARSIVFGDRRSDLQAAFTAGVPHRILLGTDGVQEPDSDDGGLATARFRSLSDAIGSRELRPLMAAAHA